MADADPIVIRRYLQKVLSSEPMDKSEASQRLLRYLTERALRGETPKETEIAIDVFGRDASFNSAEESLVRVAVRALRRRLHDYYLGPGQQDDVRFDVPKGGYRLVWVTRESEPAVAETATPSSAESPPAAEATAADNAPQSPAEPAQAKPSDPWIRRWALAATVLLGISVLINSYLWLKPATAAVDPATAEIARSPLWHGIIDSDRPLMLVLGDGFMYTNVDPLTGRVQLIRDRAINSSEELRVFLAQNPSIATGRGQRYTSMLQKSTAIGMASVLRLVSHPGRDIQVRARDDLQVDDLQKYDIVYIGPLSRLGPLAGHYELQSRYRYEPQATAIRDIVTGKTFVPDGEITAKHTEYALAARFVGPAGNHIVILTPGGRNSGLMLTVRTFTSKSGLQDLQKRLLAIRNPLPDSFEALLAVTSFGQTDVAAEVLAVHALPNTAATLRHTASNP
ncbi:MAG TPA: hypothetical protein VFS52_06160 [Steroidobacteraceae bacterium]|nr:hypothetical protein [Steroidobacteraceae bacterium]